MSKSSDRTKMSESILKRLNKVYINSDVYEVCLTHALTTEKEEVMGLLLGEVDEDEGISYISSYLILRRSDKQADRVEISDDQLAVAAMHAEKLSKKLKKPIRVLGWFHSHPHITVWPSHVDVRTQSIYQIIDRYFVGLIISTFSNNTKQKDSLSAKRNEVQLTCFQSQGENSSRERREIPIFIKKTVIQSHNMEIIAELPQILKEEEEILSSCYKDDNSEGDPLVILHNNAHKFNSMLHITSQVARPLYDNAIDRIQNDKIRINSAKLQTKLLKAMLKMSES